MKMLCKDKGMLFDLPSLLSLSLRSSSEQACWAAVEWEELHHQAGGRMFESGQSRWHQQLMLEEPAEVASHYAPEAFPLAAAVAETDHPPVAAGLGVAHPAVVAAAAAAVAANCLH